MIQIILQKIPNNNDIYIILQKITTNNDDIDNIAKNT